MERDKAYISRFEHWRILPSWQSYEKGYEMTIDLYITPFSQIHSPRLQKTVFLQFAKAEQMKLKFSLERLRTYPSFVVKILNLQGTLSSCCHSLWLTCRLLRSIEQNWLTNLVCTPLYISLTRCRSIKLLDSARMELSKQRSPEHLYLIYNVSCQTSILNLLMLAFLPQDLMQ